MTQRVRGCVSAVLFLFAGWVGVAALFARIESDHELRALLLIDCLVGLALCGHIGQVRKAGATGITSSIGAVTIDTETFVQRLSHRHLG